MKTHKTAWAVSAALAALFATGLQAAETRYGSTGKLSESDYRFLMNASRAANTEIELGKLAQEKGDNDEVRRLGKTLEREHETAASQIKRIARKKGAELPGGVSKEQRGEIRDLTQEKRKFDEQFVSQVVKEHREDITEFRQASKNLEDEDLREFAKDMLPKMEKHLRQAQEVQDSLK